MDSVLSEEDKEFLAKCEEEFKNRYTENDEEYMKVFNRDASFPPIMENFWQASGRRNDYGSRNDRRNNRRYHPYDRQSNRDRQGGHRGYNDHNNYSNRSRYSS